MVLMIWATVSSGMSSKWSSFLLFASLTGVSFGLLFGEVVDTVFASWAAKRFQIVSISLSIALQNSYLLLRFRHDSNKLCKCSVGMCLKFGSKIGEKGAKSSLSRTLRNGGKWVRSITLLSWVIWSLALWNWSIICFLMCLNTVRSRVLPKAIVVSVCFRESQNMGMWQNTSHLE